MFRKTLSRLLLPTLRFFCYLLLRQNNDKLRKKGRDRELITTMKRAYTVLLEGNHLNEDLTNGPNTLKTKGSRILAEAFMNVREYREEDDFYFLVAKEWVRDYEKKFHRTSLACVILLPLWFASVLFLDDYIAFAVLGLFLLGLILIPLIGMLAGALGKGWRKWVLTGVNTLFFANNFFIVF
ncbi:hypothetical protein [Lentibacillus sediminis]|uniref:hypothetical protein n=1 Tax=Lentibacillus sediminis TaxID=1940529 RepID=UPI000C1BB308|nr:hypothetical protein [Lentibacillus sediminis]